MPVGGGLSVTLGTPGLLPYQPEGLGDAEKFCSDVTFLLVLTKEGAAGDRV